MWRGDLSGGDGTLLTTMRESRAGVALGVWGPTHSFFRLKKVCYRWSGGSRRYRVSMSAAAGARDYNGGPRRLYYTGSLFVGTTSIRSVTTAIATTAIMLSESTTGLRHGQQTGPHAMGRGCYDERGERKLVDTDITAVCGPRVAGRGGHGYAHFYDGGLRACGGTKVSAGRPPLCATRARKMDRVWPWAQDPL